jgi:protein gp37
VTDIEWTDRTWNPVRGCSKVSPGCTNCYAERTAARQAHSGYEGLVRIGEGSPRWTGKVLLIHHKLDEPLSWKKPERVFVNSMSDLFHEALTNEEIAAVFAVMALTPHITFQVLTKRAQRMRDWFAWAAEQDAGSGEKHASDALWNALTEGEGCHVHRPKCALMRDDGSGVWCDCDIGADNEEGPPIPKVWPLPNVWLGVSVENQEAADERIPLLLETPAAVRFLSVEPLLGPVVLGRYFARFAVLPTVRRLPSAIDWVIVGGESGPGARSCDVAWIRSVVQQCKAARVPCFCKQLGARVTGEAWRKADGKFITFEPHAALAHVAVLNDRKGGDPAEWPADLRVRDFPRGAT